MESIRLLRTGDEALVEAFCARHPDTTLFFRSNMQQAGLEDGGQRYQGTYAAAFEGGEICALAGHFWNGNVILEAPEHLDGVLRAAVRGSGRPVHGFLGQVDQTEAARTLLGLAEAPASMESREILYGLQLADLRVPGPLADGAVTCRRHTEADVPQLLSWRIAYQVEALGETDGPRLREMVRVSLEGRGADGRLWVLEHEGRLVSMTAFNAVVPQAVQVGGVYTPPELRSRGFAAAVVAGSLLDARDEGVPRSILFTPADNRAAQACYQGLGYEEIGDYGLVLLAAGHEIP